MENFKNNGDCMRKFLAHLITDTTKFICRINAPYSIKEMTEERCEEIIRLAMVGDMILIRTKGELTTPLQPSKWTHSMVVIGGDIVSEATTKNTRLTNIMYALARTDEAILLRPTFVFDRDKIATYALSRVNRPYDFSFESTDDAYYCHELTAKTYQEVSKGLVIPKIKTILGWKWLPQSFLDSMFFYRVC